MSGIAKRGMFDWNDWPKTTLSERAQDRLRRRKLWVCAYFVFRRLYLTSELMLLGKLEEMTHHHRGSLICGVEKNCHDLTNSCLISPIPNLAPSSENANIVASGQTDIFLCSFCDKKFQKTSRAGTSMRNVTCWQWRLNFDVARQIAARCLTRKPLYIT